MASSLQIIRIYAGKYENKIVFIMKVTPRTTKRSTLYSGAGWRWLPVCNCASTYFNKSNCCATLMLIVVCLDASCPTEIETSLAKGYTFISKIARAPLFTRGRQMRPIPGSDKELAITLQSVERNYAAEEAYSFVIPKVNISCECSCQKRNNMCTESRDESFGAEKGISFTHFSVGNTNNCKLCCHVHFQQTAKVYEAISVKNSWVNYKIRFHYVNEQNSTAKTVDIPESIKRIAFGRDTIVEILESKAPSLLMPGGSYYYSNTTQQIHLVQNKINGRDEYDLQKAGWLKTNLTPEKREYLKQQLRRALDVKETTCLPNLTLFDWDLKAKYFYRNSFMVNADDETIQDVYGDIFESVSFQNVSKRLIIQYAKEPPLHLRISRFTSQTKTDTFFMEAEIQLDAYSNRLLSLNIRGITGTLYGTVGASQYGKTESITVIVADQSATTQKIPLSSAVAEPQWVCLYPQSDKDQMLCSYAEFTETGQHQLVVKGNTQKNEKYPSDTKPPISTSIIAAISCVIIAVSLVTGILIFVCRLRIKKKWQTMNRPQIFCSSSGYSSSPTSSADCVLRYYN